MIASLSRKWIVLPLCLCVSVAVFPSAFASSLGSPGPSLETLRATVAALEAEAASLEEQNQGLRAMLQALESDDP
jgi:hypothetical protein